MKIVFFQAISKQRRGGREALTARVTSIEINVLYSILVLNIID